MPPPDTEKPAVAALRAHAEAHTPPNADAAFLQCLIPALVAALPYFLDAFFRCVAGDGQAPADDYKPGHRPRCP